jgi:hypothetical protein
VLRNGAEMVLVHVDDILQLSHDIKPTVEALKRLHELKPESCGPPTRRHSGANVSEHQLEDGRMSWSVSAQDCVKNAVKSVTERKTARGESRGPEVRSSRSDNLAKRHQQLLIGVLRWACELGCIDILFEISLLASHTAMPR